MRAHINKFCCCIVKIFSGTNQMYVMVKNPMQSSIHFTSEGKFCFTTFFLQNKYFRFGLQISKTIWDLFIFYVIKCLSNVYGHLSDIGMGVGLAKVFLQSYMGYIMKLVKILVKSRKRFFFTLYLLYYEMSGFRFREKFLCNIWKDHYFWICLLCFFQKVRVLSPFVYLVLFSLPCLAALTVIATK